MPRPVLLAALRTVLDRHRAVLLADPAAMPPALDELVMQAEGLLVADAPSGMRRVINATGIVLHTNLGRAPLAAPAIRAMTEVGSGLHEPRIRPR